MNQINVSVLMPACNVEQYLRQAVDSVLAQSMRQIELICVDDGSTDATGEILDEYAAADPRVQVIHKENAGYGHSMNVALDHARGEYIGIVETDDFADPQMYEQLWETARRSRADAVWSNFYNYISKPTPQSTRLEVWGKLDQYRRVLLPIEHPDLYRVRPCIWAGIYRREFLTRQKIRFHETPGASYQDLSFAYQVRALARRLVIVPEAYLHYRIDNENSSVYNPKKLYCVCDEYDFIQGFLEAHPEEKARLERLTEALKYENYRWNCERLSPELRTVFLEKMAQTFREDRERGLLDRRLFSDKAWRNLWLLLRDPTEYGKLFEKTAGDTFQNLQSVRRRDTMR